MTPATVSPAGAWAGAGTTAAVAQAAAGAITTTPAGDWLTFDYNGARSGAGPAATGITPANLKRLKRQSVQIDGTVDSSAVALGGAVIMGARHDAFFVTTSYGRTLAVNAVNGRTLWEYAPASARRLSGSAQITNSTPLIDPDLRYIYTTSPDGFVHKLSVASGRQLWSTRVTWLPSHEKLAGALNLDDGQLVVVTDGYDGDAPPYQGHVVTIDPDSGQITHVFNTLCSNVRHLIRSPAGCSGSDSAIWGRPGSVIEPDGRILVATGNGPFNGHTNWGDSVLELSPNLRLLHNWTPDNQQQLNSDDLDLGSTEPALLPATGSVPLAVQGGKSGILQLLDLDRLDGTAGAAGPRAGGELQSIAAPGPVDVFSQPAVWRSGTRTLVFVADPAGTAAYALVHGRLRLAWKDGSAGTSPLIAGGLLYVYDMNAGVLNVRNPRTGRLYASLPAAPGHWNSPIVVGGRIILPVGDANSHLGSGTIEVYRLPGR
ncbi:MAG: PQQ-binding-like beta-propeller repeat protein [Solirubrobacteraceae bacterium]